MGDQVRRIAACSKQSSDRNSHAGGAFFFSRHHRDRVTGYNTRFPGLVKTGCQVFPELPRKNFVQYSSMLRMKYPLLKDDLHLLPVRGALRVL